MRLLDVIGVRYHKNALRCNERLKSRERILYQRIGAENIQKLFGVRASAARPKPAADAARHDYCV